MSRSSRNKNQSDQPAFADPQNFLMNAPIGIFTTTPDGRYLSVNNTLALMHGYDSPRQLMDSITDIATQIYVDPADRDELKRLLEKYGKVSNFECRLRHISGSYFWVSENINVMKDEYGNVIGYQGFNLDITERKQADEALLHSRDLLRYIVEHTRSAVAVHDRDLNYIFVSQRYLDEYKVKEEEVIGKHHYQVFPDLPQKWRDVHQKALKGEVHSAEDDPYYRDDGTVEWTRWECRPWYEQDGSIGGIIVYTEVITERKQAEEALRQSEEKHRLLYETMAQGVIHQHADGSIISVNPAAEKILGLTSDEMRGRTSMDPYWKMIREDGLIVKGDDHPAMIALRTGKTVGPAIRGVFNPERNDYVWLSITAMPLFKPGDAKPFQTYSTFEDITELKKTTEALRKSERQLANALHMARMGQWELDIAAGVFTFSDNFYEIFYTSAKEMGGSTMTVEEYANRFIHPEDRSLLEEETQKALRTDDPDFNRYFEHRMLYADGTVGYIGVRFLIEKDEHGRTVKTYGVNQDITQRKQDEKALLMAKEEAEAANRAKSEFLANMSHEIRTPINGIMGMMQLLQMTELTPDQKEYVETSISSTRRLTRLLSDILDLSRIEAGKIELREEELDISELCDSLNETFAVTAREKNIALEYNIDSSLPRKVMGDSVRVRQVLFNLVGNALKYTDKGKISLMIYPVSRDQKRGLRVLFSVKDTGIGISEEKLKDLFEPFVQVDGSHTRKYQGAGLGLSIVRKLVQLMNGNISMESASGQGTTVHVVLPLKISESSDSPAIQEETTPAQMPSLNILLAEDDPTNRFAMRKILEFSGHKATVAHNGQQALDFLKENDFDCILMDIQMPVMDGVEATREIRRLEDEKNFSIPASKQSRIPIIALTAHTMAGDREKFLEAGMDEYLPKPVDIDDFHRVFERIKK